MSNAKTIRLAMNSYSLLDKDILALFKMKRFGIFLKFFPKIIQNFFKYAEE